MADTHFVDKDWTRPIVAAWLNDVNKTIYNGADITYATTTGSGSAYVLTLPAGSLYSAVSPGDTFTFKVHTANTGSCTLQVVGGSTTTAYTIKTSAGSLLTAGQLSLGAVATVVFDGTNWQYNSLAATTSLPSSSVTFLQAGTGAVTTDMQTKGRQIYSVFDFMTSAQIADVIARTLLQDVTTAIQAAITAAAGNQLFFPEGSYLWSAQLTIPSNSFLMGSGPKKTILKKKSTFPLSAEGLVNATTTNDGALHDTDIHIEGITFDGSSIANTTGDMIGMAAVDRFQFINCEIINHVYIGLASAGCQDVLVRDCFFGNLGVAGGLSTGIWLGAIGSLNSTRCLVTGSRFINNLGSGCSMHCNYGIFTNNFCYNNGESTIFGNQTGSHIAVTNNVINRAVRQQISAEAIELGTKTDVLISGNHISNTDSDGIALTDVSNAVICNNIIVDSGRDNAYYAYNAGIILIRYDSLSSMNNVQVFGNRIYDSANVGKIQKYGLTLQGSIAMTNITVRDNDFTGVSTSGVFVNGIAGAQADTLLYRNRRQDGVIWPADCQSFVVQAPASTGNFVATTTLEFVPRYIEITATVSSATQIFQSVGTYNFNGTFYDTTSTASDASNRYATTSATAIVKVTNATGTDQCVATVVSAQYGGFTLNFSVTSVRPWLNVRCYP